ncbi:MAG: hypothetical protein IPN34_12070 [Planctomycetes bacterium]|nr:hypothetical protein [Planctomycetota bacterium]
MKTWFGSSAVIALFGLLALASCSGGESKGTGGTGAPPPAASKGASMRLAAEPPGAVRILEARKLEPAAGEVVVYGRVLSIVPGYAVFSLIDQELDYCGSGSDPMDTCPTPWDYCCIPGEKKAEHTLLVEARDAQGTPLADALADLRLLDLVVAKGKLERDENGNTTVIASGWFNKERPKLPEGLEWPAR